jgi:O-antigen/teichoic acid export membrane protein
VPLSLVGTAVSQVFFVRAAESHREGSLTGSVNETYALLASTSIAPLFAVCAVAPEVFGFLFGADWIPAGEYAVWLAPWIALMAIASPLTRIFDVMERQRVDLLLGTIVFLLVAGALVIGSRGLAPIQAVILLSVGGSIGRLVQIVVACRLAGLRPAEIVRPFVRPLVEGALLFALLSQISHYVSPAWTTLSLLVALAVWLVRLLRRMSDSSPIAPT